MGVDTIRTALYLALHALQEPTLPLFSAQVSKTALYVMLERIPHLEAQAVLHVMLDGMPNRLDQAVVLPVQMESSLAFSAQYPISAKNALNPLSHTRERAHVSRVKTEGTSVCKARVQALIVCPALQDNSFQLVV